MTTKVTGSFARDAMVVEWGLLDPRFDWDHKDFIGCKNDM